MYHQLFTCSKMNTSSVKNIFIAALLMLIYSIYIPVSAQQTPVKYSYNIIPSEANTWGYSITKNGKVVIKQTTVPSQPGVKGFRKKDDAAKVAALVIKKMKAKNELPTISKEELTQLHIQL